MWGDRGSEWAVGGGGGWEGTLCVCLNIETLQGMCDVIGSVLQFVI